MLQSLGTFSLASSFALSQGHQDSSSIGCRPESIGCRLEWNRVRRAPPPDDREELHQAATAVGGPRDVGRHGRRAGMHAACVTSPRAVPPTTAGTTGRTKCVTGIRRGGRGAGRRRETTGRDRPAVVRPARSTPERPRIQSAAIRAVRPRAGDGAGRTAQFLVYFVLLVADDLGGHDAGEGRRENDEPGTPAGAASWEPRVHGSSCRASAFDASRDCPEVARSAGNITPGGLRPGRARLTQERFASSIDGLCSRSGAPALLIVLAGGRARDVVASRSHEHDAGAYRPPATPTATPCQFLAPVGDRTGRARPRRRRRISSPTPSCPPAPAAHAAPRPSASAPTRGPPA